MVAQNWQHRMLAGHQDQANTIMGQRTGPVRSAQSALREQMMLMASAPSILSNRGGPLIPDACLLVLQTLDQYSNGRRGGGQGRGPRGSPAKRRGSRNHPGSRKNAAAQRSLEENVRRTVYICDIDQEVRAGSIMARLQCSAQWPPSAGCSLQS